jgi:uncharacterized membrane protein YfcA
MSLTELLIILALTGYAVYKQTRINEVTGRGRFTLAIIYAAVGLGLGIHVQHSASTLALLAVSLLASLVVGLIRGRRTKVWREADGRIFSRGTAFTIGIFLALIAFKFGLGTFAYFAHVSDNNGIGEILLMIGLMVAVQAEIIWRRAQNLGARTPGAQSVLARI